MLDNNGSLETRSGVQCGETSKFNANAMRISKVSTFPGCGPLQCYLLLTKVSIIAS